MATPSLSGFHHLKIPVADLEASSTWYQKVFDARRLERLDHVDRDGTRYATIMEFPGLPVLIELRWAPAAAHALRQCDLLVLALTHQSNSTTGANTWTALGVEHSPILRGAGGAVLVIVDPDGKYIRLMMQPPGGLASQTMPDNPRCPEGPWLNAPQCVIHLPMPSQPTDRITP